LAESKFKNHYGFFLRIKGQAEPCVYQVKYSKNCFYFLRILNFLFFYFKRWKTGNCINYKYWLLLVKLAPVYVWEQNNYILLFGSNISIFENYCKKLLIDL